jgi:hypothetical protein
VTASTAARWIQAQAQTSAPKGRQAETPQWKLEQGGVGQAVSLGLTGKAKHTRLVVETDLTDAGIVGGICSSSGQVGTDHFG